jgi:hypothetical protein
VQQPRRASLATTVSDQLDRHTALFDALQQRGKRANGPGKH